VAKSRPHGISRIAGFQPGSRGPFLSGKGPKTNGAQSASFNGTDANLRRAGQLAPLKQGPQADENVPPLGQTAGIGTWETNIAVTHLKETEIII
jgi:hypothetical protein